MKTLVYLSFFFTTIHTVVGQKWTEPVTIYYGGTNSYPDFTIDKNGYIHCVWGHVVGDNHSIIFYSKSTDNGETWSQAENISLNPDKSAGYAQIVADTFNNLYVSYDYNIRGYPETMIYFQKYDGLTWSEPLSVSGPMPGPELSYLVIDKENRIYCFWNYFNKYAKFHYRYLDHNGIWSDILNPFEGLNVYSFFYKGVVDDQNTMHVVSKYINYDQGSDKILLNYLTFKNNSWTINNQISDCEDYPLSSADINLSSENIPGFVWQQWGFNSLHFPYSTFFSELKGVIPSPRELISENSSYAVFSYDFKNKPHIIAVEWIPDSLCFLAYYKNVEGTWEKEILEENLEAFYTPVIIRGDSSLFLIYGKADTIEYAVNKSHTMFLTRRLDLPLMGQETIQDPKITIFPNPFSSCLSIKFEHVQSPDLTINIYSINGEFVNQIKKKAVSPEQFEVTWDGKDHRGKNLPGGLYLMQILYGNRNFFHKIIKQ